MVLAGTPDCRKCEHQRGVLGSTHSACHHPSIQREHGMELLAVLGGLPDLNAASRLGVTCHAHGLRSGWFAWPYNYDPVWLLSCNGFQERETAEVRG